ncbi:hypothetical protein FE257_006398 [Aspergillus nanangensis]|uniref:Uncharacterized protein n=1 Tax=Aspergillus nanangensis TaxID=2582783 RepID=A0AAD4CXG7_ASPNN|nr:hypothetical protein FE257_006398 [Aspergillus nanangensis]
MIPPKPRKKSYTDLGSILILLATFAGAVTLSTQFTVANDCDHSRARALLAFASQFFLVCPIGILTIFICLHGYEDHQVLDAGRHAFVRFQFAVVGVMLCAGFLLLNLSVLYTGAQYLGTSGAVVTGVFILTTTLWSIEAHLEDNKTTPGEQGEEYYGVEEDHTGTVMGFLGFGEELRAAKKVMRRVIFLVLLLELVGIVVLLALGIKEVVDVAKPDACQLI